MARFALPVFAGLCLTIAACGASPQASVTLDSNSAPTQNSAYPIQPDLTITPGVLCASADTYRYPEHIKYCNRSVSTGTKNAVIETYDQTFSFTIESMQRTDFKIDHFIPLCMGGANERGNLWPQHKSVYALTDPMEMTLCQLLASAKITQAAAIEKIKYAKFHLGEAVAMEAELERQNRQ